MLQAAISVITPGARALVTGYIFIGLYSFWAIYYAIRGISYSNKLPGNKGIGMAVTGLILSIIGTLGMIGIIALIVLVNHGALGQ